MTDKDDVILSNYDYSLAAVKFRGHWRFFYDIEPMFLLDYTKYSDYIPEPGGYRDGLLIIDESNAERWMSALAGEVMAAQLTHLYWKGRIERVKLTFVIDFDEKLWVGSMWHMDQSALDEYQPSEWLADEDDVMKYLPEDIQNLFVGLTSMTHKIPPELLIIPIDKLTHYLLMWHPKDDKSKFLANAGFTLENLEILEKSIRELAANGEAVVQRVDRFGTHYHIIGELTGPNGRILAVMTIWINERDVITYRFVTLKPWGVYNAAT